MAEKGLKLVHFAFGEAHIFLRRFHIAGVERGLKFSHLSAPRRVHATFISVSTLGQVQGAWRSKRGGKLRACEHLFCTIVVEPVFTRLKAHDDRVAGGGVVLRGVLVWRSVAAADVAALCASAKMQPPCALSQAFDATRSARLGRWVDPISHGFWSFHGSHQMIRYIT